MTIRVLLVDDERLARRALSQLLAAHADVEIVGECVDGIAAREVLATIDVDVVFLDVVMPAVSGLELAADTGRRPLIVFVTAHEDFGASAFATGAAEYILKPVTQERLDLALTRVRDRLEVERDAERFRALATDRSSPYLERLVTRVGNRDLVISCDDIDLIVADDVYAAVHVNGRRYLVRTALDELERSLDPARFARVHRSYIVAIRAVASVRRRDRVREIELRSGVTVPVSRRRIRELARIDAVLVREVGAPR
jgi:two-component system LytT family response regulator